MSHLHRTMVLSTLLLLFAASRSLSQVYPGPAGGDGGARQVESAYKESYIRQREMEGDPMPPPQPVEEDNNNNNNNNNNGDYDGYGEDYGRRDSGYDRGHEENHRSGRPYNGRRRHGSGGGGRVARPLVDHVSDRYYDGEYLTDY